MPKPLTGLSTGYIDPQPQAPPEQVHGGFVDPGHSGEGKQPEPYSWQVPAWGTDPMGTSGTDWSLVGETHLDGLPPGDGSGDLEHDYTPYTHAAPWPKNPAGDGSVGPDNTARQLIQSAVIHGVKTNASGRMTYAQGMDPQQDQWVEYASATPGTSMQPAGVPQSVGTTVGGFGSRDVVNSHAPQNQYGFNTAHLHRRVATGSIPGNYQWMRPGSRPLIRTLPGANRLPVGQVSPFTGQDIGTSFSPAQAVLTATPPDYTPVPQPTTAPLPATAGAPQPGIFDFLGM